jgi:uncharacterized protein YvpB
MKTTTPRKLILILLLCSLTLPAAVSAATVPAAIASSAAALSKLSLPEVHIIKNIVGRKQAFPLSCESRSAVDLANYWGIKVDEIAFFNVLPKSDNPEKGFVGSVFGIWGQTPPKPYGVHARPIANNLRKYSLNARAHYGMSLAALKFEIASGRPVVVWVVGHVWEGTPKIYIAEDGSEVTVARYEHTMLAYGYDKAGVYLIDPGSGLRRNYGYTKFMASWEVLGNMAVTVSGIKHLIHDSSHDR